MGKLNYAPLISDMVWSYSRIHSFEDCRYRWFMHYIKHLPDKQMFFSSYGTFMHKLLELYNKGERMPDELRHTYLTEFRNEVKGDPPNEKVFTNFFNSGWNHLKNLKPLPFKIIGVEQEILIDIGGKPFTGYIDVIGERDGGIYIIDHKSHRLKPRSHRRVPTDSDKELDSYLRQLYLYGEYIKQSFGVAPKGLCFNCFRENRFIEEPYVPEVAESTKVWALNAIDAITKEGAEGNFDPNIEYFKCNYICGQCDSCEYYAMFKGVAG